MSGVGREALVELYTRGSCMVLADVLAAGGLQPVGIHDEIWDRVPRHVGVALADGSYADARGARLDRAAFLDGWPARRIELRPLDRTDLRRIWGRRVRDWNVPQAHLDALGLAHLIAEPARLDQKPRKEGIRP